MPAARHEKNRNLAMPGLAWWLNAVAARN